MMREPSAGVGFLCLLSLPSKESEAPPAGRNALAEKQPEQPRRSTHPKARRCLIPGGGQFGIRPLTLALSPRGRGDDLTTTNSG
jgi:hypothetical protein